MAEPLAAIGENSWPVLLLHIIYNTCMCITYGYDKTISVCQLSSHSHTFAFVRSEMRIRFGAYRILSTRPLTNHRNIWLAWKYIYRSYAHDVYYDVYYLMPGFISSWVIIFGFAVQRKSHLHLWTGRPLRISQHHEWSIYMRHTVSLSV